MLALLNQQLTSLPWVYDGALVEHRGRIISIHFCMLSGDTSGVSADARCSFGFAVASVSLALSLIWSYVQILRRNPFKHTSARLADLVLCGTWLALWCAAAVVLCIWTDAANRAGSFLRQARDARNGLCVLAWLEFLLVAALTGTAALLFTTKSQGMFDRMAAKAAAKKAAKEERRLCAQRDKAAQQEAAAAAAAAAAAGKQVGAAAPSGAAAAAGPRGAAAVSGAAQPGGGTAGAGAGAGAGAQPGGAGRTPASAVVGDRGGDNPFLTPPGPNNV